MRSNLVFWIYCPACVLVAAVVVVGIVALIVYGVKKPSKAAKDEIH